MKLTRYLSISKFISLLEDGLFLPKANLFQDPLEGVLGGNYWEEGYKNKLSWMKEWIYVSCWHASLNESFAMWKVYGMEDESIAITIDSELLESCVSENKDNYALLKHVSYSHRGMYPKPIFEFNRNNKNILLENELYEEIFEAMFVKSSGYEYEKEVRLAVVEKENVEEGQINTNSGIYLPFKKELIQTITMSPLAQDWFYNVICSIIEKYELKAELSFSEMSDFT